MWNIETAETGDQTTASAVRAKAEPLSAGMS